MPCSRKFLVFAGCAVLACAGLGVSAAEKKDKEKDKDKSKPSADAPAKPDKKGAAKKGDKKGETPVPDDGSQPPKLVIPLPKGQDSKGVIIPYGTDASGKKSMVFKIGVGTRVDENHVKMTDVVIETYDEQGQQDMTIALPASILDMQAQTISGDQSVTINRSDFQITGKNMEFNTETRKGWIKGDVKMIIYDLSEEAAADTPKEPKADSENQTPKGS